MSGNYKQIKTDESATRKRNWRIKKESKGKTGLTLVVIC